MPQFEFIRSQVLARLKAGQFVPVRKNKQGRPDDLLWENDERRNTLSPLAITKQCIRYEPRVFVDRHDTILKLAHDLNNPSIKIIMLQGDQGSGKTSLVRGVIELMGGELENSKPAQLLWFDANRYTDFNEVTQFLVQYIAYLGNQLSGSKISADSTLHPTAQLSNILDAMGDVPLLIVLDNMEYLVNSQLQLNSPPFKELLNFLLQFSSIKIMMLGERLPYQDLAPNLLPSKSQAPQTGQSAFTLPAKNTASHLDEIKLYGLPEKTTTHWLAERAKTALSKDQIHKLHQGTQGYPWLVKTLLYLNQKAGMPFAHLLALLENDNAIEALSQLIYEGLAPVHRQAVQLMVLARHPLDTPTLSRMLPVCFPASGHVAEALSNIEQSILRPILKINYAPQDVLRHIQTQQARLKAGKEALHFIPAYDLYHVFKKILYRQMSPFERLRLHEALHEFYVQENSRQANQETEPGFRISKKSCVTEANFHMQMAQKTDVSTTFSNASTDTPSISSWQSQAYQANAEQHAVETLKPRHSLDDYRTIVISENENEQDSNSPNRKEYIALPTPSEQDIAWENLLTPEEKQLLGLQPSDFTKTQNSSPLHLAASPSGHNAFASLEALAHESTPTPSEYEHDEQLKAIQQRMTLAVANRNKAELLHQLIALSDYWLTKQQWSRAEECIHKALSIEEQQFEDHESPLPVNLLAQAWYHRGILFQHHYKTAESQACFEQAYRKLQAASPNMPASHQHLCGLICQKLADGFIFQNDLPNAIHWQELAILHIDKAYQHPDGTPTAEEQSLQKQMLAEGYFKQGQLLDETGRIEEAIHAYQRSLSENQGNNHEAAAAALSNIGQLYAEQEQFDTAIEHLKQALAYDKQTQQEDIIIQSLETTAVTYEAWADTLAPESTERAQRLDEAETLLQQALQIATRYHHDDQLQKRFPWRDHPNVVLSNLYLKLGVLCERRNQPKQALQYFQKALETGRSILSNSSIQYLKQCIHTLESEAAEPI